MVDIETLGTRPGAAIASIGACAFGDGLRREYRKQFRVRVELVGQDALGLHLDPETVTWWLQQSDQARAALTRDFGRVVLPTALLWLTAFIQEARVAQSRPLEVWANGANFDTVLLEAAYRACGLTAPWEFRQVRCHRTLLKLADLDGKAFATGLAHDALDDAMAQADAAEAALARLAGAASSTQTQAAP
jgi:hypothetical protein